MDQEGPRYKIEKVEVESDEATDPEPMFQVIDTTTGEPVGDAHSLRRDAVNHIKELEAAPAEPEAPADPAAETEELEADGTVDEDTKAKRSGR